MRKLLPVLAIFGIAAAPGVAQTTNSSQPAPTEKPKTVTKVVCERVTAEQETGSRLGAAPKKCKKVEVLAPDSNGGAQTQPQGHSAHAQ